ncbi:hypothetical protein [Paludibaculum fermentans]|uniref:Uncharacterized protein n=1 Tax=Paludibaculum fermentans TaxID=1473598 RepID=A0A7S7NTQ0_PALFE|nr:hypothetical protein [Paludibaculum fermentans]QOY89084.1 hypothetical protein IRI77_03750 [Paludibaculum fermentans]
MKRQLLVFLFVLSTSASAEPWRPPAADAANLGQTALSEAESERYEVLTGRVIRSANERMELADGFRYVLDSEVTEPAEVIEWMRLQSRSCPFVSYSLHFTAGGDLLLDLRGPDGVKELLQLELPPLAARFI